MFTLITLSVLALLAGATFTVKKVLNKKREAISHTRKVYATEALDAYTNSCGKIFHSGRKTGKSTMMAELQETDLKFKKDTIKHIKRKKSTKSKHIKRFI